MASDRDGQNGRSIDIVAESTVNGEFDVDVANALLDGGRDTALGVFSECGLHP